MARRGKPLTLQPTHNHKSPAARTYSTARETEFLRLSTYKIRMPASQHYTKSFILLQQEGHLFSSCLATGLTQLRRAHTGNKGEFYGALFNLSIGTERLLKSILIMDHMLTNYFSPPSRKQLKAYGHDLIDLYDACAEVSTRFKNNVPISNNLEPITLEILKLLSDFAESMRYHNLDALSNASPGIDPLKQIGSILKKILQTDGNPKIIQKIKNEGKIISKLLEEGSIVRAQGLEGQDMSLSEIYIEPNLHEHATKYAVLRITQLIDPLRELIRDISHQAQSSKTRLAEIPYMHEFLSWMSCEPRYTLNKKQWP